MSDERGSDNAQTRKQSVFAALPGFLLKDAWVSDELPPPPEPDPTSASERHSWIGWLLEKEHLPGPPAPDAQPKRTSFLRWLLSPEALPEPGGGGRHGVASSHEPQKDAEPGTSRPTLFRWLVSSDPLPYREPAPRAAPGTSVWRRLADIATPTLVLGVILALTFAADDPVREGRTGLGLVYAAAMLATAFSGAVVTARWLYPPEIGRKLSLFYVGFGFLWLNLHLLLIHTNTGTGGPIALFTHLALANGIAALATVVLRRVTRPRS